MPQQDFRPVAHHAGAKLPAAAGEVAQGHEFGQGSGYLSLFD
jgi:hypothetical protein